MKQKPICDISGLRGFDLEELIQRTRDALFRKGMVEEEKQFMAEVEAKPYRDCIISAISRFVNPVSRN